MSGYGEIRSPLDQKAVDDYLEKHVEGYKGPALIKQFSFGQSNPTYFLRTPSGARYVLRKKPSGPLVSPTAHAIDREYSIISALHASGKIPVPRMYCLCLDKNVLGTEFYVMEFLEGRIFEDVRMPDVGSDEDRKECWESIIKVLAELHKIKPAEIGLEGFGSSKPFYPRQIKALSRVSNAQSKVKSLKTGKEVGPIPQLEFLLNWYAKNCPIGDGWEGGVVHGDFKCDNMIFHPTENRVIGVLDWELSTIGHPLTDLANLLQPFQVPSTGSSSSAFLGSHLTPLKGISPKDLPIPSEDYLLKYYCQKVGREYPIEKWGACVSFAFFRLSVIMQGIASRAAQGQASSANAHVYGDLFVPLARLAIDSVREEEVKLGRGKL